MHVLIANNSFKDVFDPITLGKIILESFGSKYEIELTPMCDGGEYTFDILTNRLHFRIVEVDDVINPYGIPSKSRYLVKDDCAYIVSSEILRLMPFESKYKNPLLLTDYGLGQLLSHAIEKGYKKIYICLGGTSTVGFGLGAAQALGAIISDKNGQQFNKPIVTSQYRDIDRIDFKRDQYKEVELVLVNDSDANTVQMEYTSDLKIGLPFRNMREEILSELRNCADIVSRLTGLSIRDVFSGNAGGVYFGMKSMFHTECIRGTDYFINLFELERKIKSSDLVITGEGKYDCYESRKMTTVIMDICRRHRIPVILICGQKDASYTNFFLNKIGATHIINCQDYYGLSTAQQEEMNYEDLMDFYRVHSPEIIKKQLKSIVG